jgi:hypothetical protein
MYETDPAFLPDEVTNALTELEEAVVRHTDYNGFQVSYDQLRGAQLRMKVHVIVEEEAI